MPPRESRVPSSAVPQTRREARQRQRQIARLAEQRAGFEEVDKEQDLEFEGGEFVPDEQAVDEAEQNVAEETASQQPFVEPGDIDVGINENTLTSEVSLTEEERQRAQQRQAEQLRQEAASQSDRFGEGDFRIDRSGEQIEVEPTQSAINRERREQAVSEFESNDFIDELSPADVEINDEGVATLDEDLQATVTERQRQAARENAADEIASSSELVDEASITPSDIKLDEDSGSAELREEAENEIRKDASVEQILGDQTGTISTDQAQELLFEDIISPEEYANFQAAKAPESVVAEGDDKDPTPLDSVDDITQAVEAGIVEKSQFPAATVGKFDTDQTGAVPLDTAQELLFEDIISPEGYAEFQAARAPDALAEGEDQDPSIIESESQLEQAVEAGILSRDTIPTQNREQALRNSLEIDDDGVSIDESLQRSAFREDVAVETSVEVDESDIINEDGSLRVDETVADQIQRNRFAEQIESGEAFEDTPDDVDPSTLVGDVDPQEDIVETDDGSLTLADETQADINESQIRSQVGDTPGLNTDNVLERAVDQADIRQAIEEQIEEQTGTDVRPGLIEDVNLDIDPDGTVRAERVLLNSRRFDDFFDVGEPGDRTDVLEGANLSVDATEQFTEQVEQSIAEQISERNVVDVSPNEIDISGGNVGVPTPESLTIEAEEITADGLSESGQADFARRQLQSIQTTDGVSVDTPVNSQPFANVSAQLAQAAEGQGSLSSATRIVAASDTVSNVGDLDDLPDSRIIAGLEPDQAEERLGIDPGTVREAQSDIQQRRQQLESDPGAVLESIASNQDEFVNDSTRIGVAGERGQRIRQAARSQLNELEENIAAGDDSVSPGDVNLSLTDDLSGIRSVNEAGQRAIAEQVDERLPNFGAEEINVGVSGGEITTSIEDSVRQRFVQNAQRVEEIQVRNDIADSTEGIGRRDIEVSAGEGVSPSDQLITETLGTDVNANIESFDQLQSAAQAQARFDARQQAIQQVESQTIGAVDPRNVTVERTEQGFEANVSGAAAESVDLSAVDVGQTTTVQTTNQTDTNVSLGNLSNVTGAVGLDTPAQIDVGGGEEFGDAVPDFIEDPARGFQSGVSQIGAQLGGGVGDVVEQVGEVGAPVEQGENFVGQTPAESTGNLAEGAIEGTANLIGSAPVVGVEATEFGIFAAQNPGETAEQLPDAISERALLAGEQATSSPAQFTGQIVGSGAGSGALFKATQGTRLGTVTRATLQPGEELVKAGVRRGALGERAIDVTPGVRRGQIDRDFGSERGQTSPLLGAERLLDDSGDGDTTIEIEDTGPRADVDNDPRTGLDDIEQAAARGRQRSVDIDQDLDTSVRSVSQDAEIRSPSRSVGGGSDSRPISEIDPDLTPRETQLAAQLDTPTGDLRSRVDIDEQTPDIDLRQLGPGETGSVSELISRTESTTDTVALEDQTPEVAFDSEPGSVDAGGGLAETVETGVSTSVESQFRQPVGETGQQQFFQRARATFSPDIDTDTRLGVTPGSDINPSAQRGVGVEVEPDALLDGRAGSSAETDTGFDTGLETSVETDTGFDTGLETSVETDTGFDTGVGTQLETEREREFEIDLKREPGTEARRSGEGIEESQSEAGLGTALDSEVAEFDFLTLDQTDDRIENVLGGG